MPGVGKYGTVYDKLPAKKPLLEKLFRSSPMYDGSYGHAKLVDTANAALIPAVQHGDLQLYPSVDMDYGAAPKFSDVQVGDAGRPGTPYTPNLASPGEGNGADPTKLPDSGLVPTDIRPNFVPGENGTLEPAAAAFAVSTTKLGKALTLGQSPKA
jgi:hypothetical protein